MRRFSDAELKTLRNNVPVKWVIETLLQLPGKEVEGVYRFHCPECGEFQTGLNPHVNLARCFRCCKNFNPIELVMAERGLNFVKSVNLLREQAPLAKSGHGRRRSGSATQVVNQDRPHQRSGSVVEVLLKLAETPYPSSFLRGNPSAVD